MTEARPRAGGAGPTQPRSSRRDERPAWIKGVSQTATGLALGLLTGSLAGWLGLQSVPLFRSEHFLLGTGLMGAFLAHTRLKGLLWVGAVGVSVLWLGVAYTPLIVEPTRSLVRRDAPARSDAIVVLSSDIRLDGTLTPAAQIRLLRGYELLRGGFAPTLVLTRLPAPRPPYRPTVETQMDQFRLDFPVEEVGPVTNTHDEAVAVSGLYRRRGWKRVILVSDPLHMRRARAVFLKAGVAVLCVPSADREFDSMKVESPHDRVNAFRECVWEYVGYLVYQRNGWI